MEYRQPHEIALRLIEARMALKTHIALETALIERINELPEDDFCHTARETFQMGAGYAFLQRDLGPKTAEDVLATFFATQPRNRYLDPETVELERKTISNAAMELIQTGEMMELDSYVDPYCVEAAAAFIEGYAVITSLASQETLAESA